MGKLNSIAALISNNGLRIYRTLNNYWQSCQRYISGSRPLPPAELRINKSIKSNHAALVRGPYTADSLYDLLECQQTYIDIGILALLPKYLVSSSNSEVLFEALGFKNKIIDSTDVLKNLTSIDIILDKPFVKVVTDLITLRNKIRQQQVLAVQLGVAYRQLDNKEIHQAKYLITKKLPKLISLACHISKQQAKVRLAENKSRLLSDRPWLTVKRQFSVKNQVFESIQTPAAQLKWEHHDSEIFPYRYQAGGVPSCDSGNTQHAMNLWVSELVAIDSRATGTGAPRKILFQGIRHGICAPRVQNPHARAAGALVRAREVITAALLLQPEKINSALRGETVDLRLTSTSLLTPVNSALFKLEEDTLLTEQMCAWEKLQSMRPLILEIRDQHNQIQRVKIALDIAAFNFGVNELALFAKLGQKKSDGYNESALKKMLGEDLHPVSAPGGWVAEYLAANPTNAKLVYALAEEIKTIWADKLHRENTAEPYMLAQRIALLSYMIGIPPCYNCKSGKDRTALLDLEIKTVTAAHYLNRPLPKPGEMLPDELKNIYDQLVLHSGNAEVQAKNTGDAGGNKSIKQFFGATLITAHRGKKDNQIFHRGLAALA